MRFRSLWFHCIKASIGVLVFKVLLKGGWFIVRSCAGRFSGPVFQLSAAMGTSQDTEP